jgi:hypothetical protein
MSNGVPSHKTSTGKWIASILAIFLILLLLCFLMLPMLFSTGPGKKYLLKMIENRTGFQMEIEELSLSWFGTQRAAGVKGQNGKEQVGLTAEEIRSSSSLWKIVFSNDLGQTQIVAPVVTICKAFQPAAYQNKRPVLKAASFVPRVQLAAANRWVSPAYRGKIVVNQGKVAFNTPGVEPMTFDQIEASLDMASKDEVALAFSCTTNPQGQIAVKASAGHLSAPYPSFAVQSSIQQMPVQGLDQLASLFYPEMSGLIYSFVGPTINLGCNLSASSGNFDLRLNALSSQITAYVATQSLNGMLSLKSPAELQYNFTPAFLQKMAKVFPALENVTLTQPALVQATVEQFSCPVPSGLEDLLKSSFQASMTAPPQIALRVNGNPVFLGNLSARASSPSLEQHLVASLSSALAVQERQGAIQIEADIQQPFNPEGMRGSVGVNAKGFPVGLLGDAALSNIVGQTADLTVTAELQPGNKKVHMSWQSDFLKIPAIDLSMGNAWTLSSPSPFAFALNTRWINTLLPKDQIQLAKADPFQGTIQSLTVPVGGLKNMQMELVLNTGQMAFTGCNPFTIAKMQNRLSIQTFDQINLQIDGDPIKGSLALAYNPSAGTATLTKPLALQWMLDPATLKTMVPSAPALAKPTVVEFSLDPFVIPVANVDVYKLKLKGQISNSEMTLGQVNKQVALLATNMPFQWDPMAKTATMQISSQVRNPGGNNGTLQGDFSLSNFTIDKGLDLNTANLQGDLQLQNLSSLLLDAFSGRSLSTIVGPVFTSRFKLQSSSADKQTLAVKWTSDNLSVDTGFAMNNGILQLQGGNQQISWTLTPESYKVLDAWIVSANQQLVPFEIKEPSVFSITLSKLSLPVAPGQEPKPAPKDQACTQGLAGAQLASRFPSFAFDLSKLELNASARNPKLTFYDRSSHETIQLSNLSVGLNKQKGTPVTVSMDSNVTTQNAQSGNAKNGSISLSGNLAQTLTPQGAFDVSKLTCSLHFKAQQLPSRALDIVARAKGRTDFPFTTVFGNVINATVDIDLNQFSGPVSVNVNTPNTRAAVNGTVAGGILTLKEDAHVQMKVTPEASRLVLKEVNPLNLSYFYSQAPVTLEIPAHGFAFRLYPFDYGKITIPNATIELGKILCKNEGNVNIALGLLKSKQFEKSKELMLWFAPIELHIAQGIADIERTEILLAETYDVCTWGKVDIVDQYVDMNLGLTAQTLKKAFGIKNLPDNYVLTLPMRGKMDNVQIDSKGATTKMGLLLAWQKAESAGGLGKGPAGAIIGGLVNKMATLPDSNAKVPPPKHPFPWEGGKGKTSQEESHVKKKQFKVSDKPLKQILKLIK